MSKQSLSALDDLSVVHRLCFAARVLPIASPNYWENIADFSIMGKSLTGNEARVFVENLKYLNPAVFDDDAKLTKELVRMPKMNAKDPEKNGLILISPIECCVFCGSKLSVRQDICAHAVIYDDYNGTLPALHFNRYCRKKGCLLQQHYGYYTQGDSSAVVYNIDALGLPYFMCTRETGFSIQLLKKLDVECLIGQISYKQSAEIFNSYHGYEYTDYEQEQKRFDMCLLVVGISEIHRNYQQNNDPCKPPDFIKKGLLLHI